MSDPPDEAELIGPYEIIRPIGRGGMAEVLLARFAGADGFEREVAIKRILPQYLGEHAFINMFRDEARITACLRHGNIVQVLEFREDDGRYSLVLEYVDGPALSAVLRSAKDTGSPLPLATVAYVVTEIARALDYAHRKRGPDGRSLGIVHRDVSPSNVLVSREGEVKLADFGIARASERLTSTGAGTVKGKMAYIAPEALTDRPTASSDLFSLGVLTWEILAGKNPFAAPSEPAQMYRILALDTPRLSTLLPAVPQAMDGIVARLLEKDPAARPKRAAWIVDALAPIVASAERPGPDVLAERVAMIPSPRAASRPSSARNPTTRSDPQGGARLPRALLVESSPTTRALLRSALSSAFEVVEPGESVPPVDAARDLAGAISLVVSQQMLQGGQTGIDLCRFMRGHPQLREVTFVLVVFESSDAIEAGARDAGVSMVVSKSEPAMLVQALGALGGEVGSD